MRLEKFLDNCINLGISFSIDGDNLKINAEPGALTEEVVKSIRAKKTELIDWLSLTPNSKSNTLGLLPRSELSALQEKINDGWLPLSFSQKRLWIIDQVEEGTSNYNMLLALNVEGQLDQPRVEKALNIIVQRHESLRTRFTVIDEEPIQKIDDQFKLKLITIDLSSKQEQRVQTILNQEAKFKFDLANGPLLRVHMLKIGSNRFVILLNTHHIISDDWSLKVLTNEFGLVYSALESNETPELNELPIQYPDFAIWQHRNLNFQRLDELRRFWSQKLSGIPQVNSLPLDRARPKIQGFNAGCIKRGISQALNDKVRELCLTKKVTPFITYHLAFSILLSRLSGEKDIVIGVPSDGRNHSELEQLIGFFNNTLVFRSQISEEATFSELLEEAKEAALEIFEHQYLPFDLLVDEMGHDRDLSYNPICQVKFQFLEEHRTLEKDFGEFNISEVSSSESNVHFDLDLSIFETSQGPLFTWLFKNELFNKKTIQFMAEQYELLLEQAVKHPDIPLSKTRLVLEVEQIKLEQLGKGDVQESSSDGSLVEIFESQAESNPQRIAVKSRDNTLTYQALNIKANQFADYLSELGVEKGEKVAIYLNTSEPLMIAILALKKLDATYIPLDPMNAKSRLEYVVKDSDVAILITEDSNLGELEFSGLDIVSVDDWDSTDWMQGYQEHNIGRAIDEEEIAYVIYTSGSTGEPKGVEISNLALLDYCQNGASDYYSADLNGSLVITSHSFDISVPSLFVPLLNGDYVSFPTKKTNDEKIIESAATLLKQEPLLIRMTPMHLRGILTVLPEGAVSNTSHRFVIGGEAFPVELGQSLQSFFPSSVIFNHYGPTETTVGCTLFNVSEGLEQATSNSYFPIGRPMPNHQLYVLDKHQRIVGKGNVGELYVGGLGLAHGYHNKPEHTKECFISNPYNSNRIYATGDLVKWGEQDQLVYVGRNDHQFKIQGFRVEIKEIEKTIKNINEVTDVIVLVNSSKVTKQIIAYIVGSISKEDIERRLNDTLPQYMIPSSFTFLEAFPLNSNGKVDIKRLSELESLNEDVQQYEMPTTDIEKKIAAVWSSLLKLEKIGVSANFFALGGDSILSIQAVSRAASQGVFFTTKQLFEHQTIKALSKVASVKSRQVFRQEEVEGETTLTPIQADFIRTASNPNHFNQSVMLKIPVEITIEALNGIISEITKRHDALRLSFREDNSSLGYKAVFKSLSKSSVDKYLSKVALDTLDDHLITNYANEAHSRINIEKGPLMQCVCFESPEGNRLLWIIHHLVVDGVSWRILLEDFESLVNQSLAGKPFSLPPKTSSVKDWGDFLKTTLSVNGVESHFKDMITKERNFWLKQLEYQKSTQSITSNSLKQNNNETTGKSETNTATSISTVLDTKNTSLLTTKALESYALNVNELMLASLFYGFYQWKAYRQLAITMEGHGREHIDEKFDLTQTIGWFTSKYPLTLSTGKSISELSSEDDRLDLIIREIKEQLRSVPNGGIGFGLGKEFLELDYQQSSPPEVVFNYLGQFDETFDNKKGVSFSDESTGENIHPNNAPEEKFTFNSLIINDSLRLNLSFDTSDVSENEAAELLECFKSSIESMVSHCVKPIARRKSISDYPQANLSPNELEYLQQTYEIENVYEATGMQSGLLFHSEMSADAYVSQMLFTINQLDITAFEYAWENLVARHDILRTAFYLSDNGYHQVVTNSKLNWKLVDLSDKSETEKENIIEDYRLSEKKEGFNIDNAQLMRICAFKLSENSYRILWSHHHALWDGWCNALLFREVVAFYQAKLDNKSIQLLSPPQYINYIDWLQKQDDDAAKRYWKEYLGIINSEVTFPQQLSNASSNTVRLESSISKELTDRLSEIALQHSFTMNTFIQASWAILLSRYTGDKTSRFGTVVSGRPAQLDGVEEIVGLFINTIPVVVKVEDNLGLENWLKSIHQRHLDSDEFSYLPLNEIKNCTSVNELFDTLVAFENYPADSLQQEGVEQVSELTLSEVDSYEETNYGLTLIVHVDSNLHFKLDYKSELYEERIVNRLLPHLENILESIAGLLESSKKPHLDEIKILSIGEEQILTEDFNDTHVNYPIEQRLHDLFIEQVKSSPNSVAIRDQDGAVTYQELFDKANVLNKTLREHGVDVDELVAVRLPKGRAQLVATLGIMMSGAAYLPLEVKWPNDRCKRVTEKAKCKHLIVLNTEDGLEHLNSTSISELLETKIEESAGLTDFSNRQSPTDLAYVIFTSGSTGEPKGVAIEHRSAVNTILDINALYEVTSSDKVLAVSALSFDLSVYDLFGLLAVGGEVVFPDDDKAMDPSHWLEIVEEYKVTLWDTVPVSASLLEEQLSFKNRISTAPLRNILMSGDWIEPGLPARLWKAFPGVNTYSLGGATEGSIWSIHYPIIKDTSGLKSVPYGKPLSNQSFYILDSSLNLAPIGVAGELCIGGVGVAREYYGDQKLSEDRFIFHKQLNQKLYRTGDLGRYMNDGNIEFMGRADHQIKIRGFRIELGEVEQKLTCCDEVLTSLVRAKEDSSGQKFLVAYFQRERAYESITESELITKLKQQLENDLPDYMLPSFFVEIASWPLTSNGKVDLKALPEINYISSQAEVVPPETETEEKITDLWGELLNLGRGQVSIDTDFIELGGHSLLAVRLVARIEQAFKIKLELRQLYLNSTIRALSAVIDKITQQQELTQKLERMEESDVEEFSL